MKRCISVILLILLSAAQVYADQFVEKLIEAAKERTRHSVEYDGSYVRIDYPNGDVPNDKGVCTDVIIRAYRKVGIDLQVEVHKDMKAHFKLYPKIWGLSKPDTNIDHRRVPNLQVFFERKGQKLRVTQNADDYKPGDLVTWMLPGNLPHIGIVVDKKSWITKRYLIVHNVGLGPRMEDFLFDYPITGHYRYVPQSARAPENQ